MLQSKSRLVLFFLILFLSSTRNGNAQDGSGSPYSRFGIGNVLVTGQPFNLGMGSTGIAYHQPTSLSLMNPAGNSSLAFTTYELAVRLDQYEFAALNSKERYFTGLLSYFAFGFPVKAKTWGLGFGLLPYSNVGYSIDQPVPNDIDVKETHTYKGSGGLNQFYIANGIKVAKKLSLGFTASYLFGPINQERTVEFNSLNLYNTYVGNSASLGWFHFDFGLQYTLDSISLSPSDSIRELRKKLSWMEDSLDNAREQRSDLGDSANSEKIESLQKAEKYFSDSIATLKRLKKGVVNRHSKSDWNLTFGLTFTPETNLRGYSTDLTYTYKYSNILLHDNVQVRDTIQYSESASGFVKLPVNVGFGLSMKKGTQWLIGADVSAQKWEDFIYFGQSDSLSNYWRVSTGFQYIPDDHAFKTWWKPLQYRMGAHYGWSFITLHGVQLTEYGICIGLGIPIRRVGTVIQFSAEGGKRGTTDHELLEEKYARFTIGFTINDRWFERSKLD